MHSAKCAFPWILQHSVPGLVTIHVNRFLERVPLQRACLIGRGNVFSARKEFSILLILSIVRPRARTMRTIRTPPNAPTIDPSGLLSIRLSDLSCFGPVSEYASTFEA